MAHVIVEYSDNLGPEADIPGLLRMIAAALVDSDGVFAVGGIRVRAIRLTDYVVADGKEDDAFVNIDVRMAGGRDEAFKKAFFDTLFDRVKTHFAPIEARRYFALSMYVSELPPISYKQNNIHTRFKAGGAA